MGCLIWPVKEVRKNCIFVTENRESEACPKEVALDRGGKQERRGKGEGEKETT